jgi:ABC-type sugar transport system permease subunit
MQTSVPTRLWESIRRIDQDHLYAFLVLLPSVILLGIFVYGFIGQTFYWSLTDWGGETALRENPPKNYVELQNYNDLFTAFGTIEPRFRLGLVNTFFFTFFFMLGCLVLGFVLAVLLDQNIKGEGFFRTVFLFPMSLSFAVSGTAWRWLFSPEGGINVLPEALGGKALTYTWLNNRQPFRFNWHETPHTTILLIILLLLAVFVSFVWRRKWLASIYFGLPMALVFLWMWSDWLAWDPAWEEIARKERVPGMHGTFPWTDGPRYLSTVILVVFILVLVSLLWQAKRRGALIVAIPTGLLFLWYVTGGPDRLPNLEMPQAELPYGFNTALIGVVIAAVWQLSGYTMAMYLAGIRGVPEELREAARVDGCSEWQVYTRIVLPLLRPITLSAAIVLGHISLKIFDLIFAMTGPDHFVVTVPGVQVYTMFRSNEFAKGSAIAMVLLVMVALVIIPYLITALRSEPEL